MQGKIDLLSNTNMVDFAKEVYLKLHPDTEVPECKCFFYIVMAMAYITRLMAKCQSYFYDCMFSVLTQKRSEVVSQLKRLESSIEPIVKIMDKPEVTSHIQASRDGRQLFETLSKEYGVC